MPSLLARLRDRCSLKRKQPKEYGTVESLLKHGKCGDFALSHSGMNIIGKGPRGRLLLLAQPRLDGPTNLPVSERSEATPCGEHPEECEPRVIYGAVFDADDTLWHVNKGIVSGCKGPWKRESEDVVVSANKCHVELLPGSREVLTTLKMAGVRLGVASANDREPVVEALKALGVAPSLISEDDMQVGWHPKSESIRALVEMWGIEPGQVSFMDDGLDNVERVYHAFDKMGVTQRPLSLVIKHRGGSYDVREPGDIFRYVVLPGEP